MTSLMYPLALGLFFIASVLLIYSMAPAGRTATVRGFQMQRVDIARMPSPLFRLLFPLLDALAPLFRNLVGWPTYRRAASVQLQRAGLGDAITVDHLLAFKAIAAIVLPFFLSRITVMFTNPALFLIAGIVGFYIPDKLVSDLRKSREKRLLRALPGSVDVLSLSVEAGLEFLIAIQRLVERGSPTPLRDELATILNDIRLGKSRSDALKSFAARVEIPEVSSFVSVLVQADALGASIGTVLQQQAERMRVERFQRAEREGAKASQKILFPLVLFIFPAVLIVILGPVALIFIYGAP